VSRSRLEKLRAMAEHPTSNPHEAANARAEIARLKLPLRLRRNSPFIKDVEVQRAEAEREDRRRYGVLVPGDDGYDKWARSLKRGDWLIIAVSYDPTSWRTGPSVTIERVTKTQYVMLGSGDRFRRGGRFPGYQVGEDGRNGRTYLVNTPDRSRR
jgi:hypothetical protein